MLDRSTLTTALSAALPASQQARAAVLADAIIASLDTSDTKMQPSIDASLVAALVGTQITTANAVLTFGQGNDMRNATIKIDDVAGGSIFKDNTIITLAINVAAPVAASAKTPSDRNRIAMLANMRRIWIDGVLHQSLWNDALLTLRLAERPDAIVHPYGLHLRAKDGDAPRFIFSGCTVWRMRMRRGWCGCWGWANMDGSFIMRRESAPLSWLH